MSVVGVGTPVGALGWVAVGCGIAVAVGLVPVSVVDVGTSVGSLGWVAVGCGIAVDVGSLPQAANATMAMSINAPIKILWDRVNNVRC